MTKYNMFYLRIVQCLSLIILLSACSLNEKDANPLSRILASDNPKIKCVMDNLAAHEIQIRYTQIDRTTDGIKFTDYDFQVEADNYFYPASTVKFPVAVLALEQLNHNDSIDRNTPFQVTGDTLITTFEKSISEIFAVSNNQANNRLVEFLGQDAINERLRGIGVTPARIANRVGARSDDLATKPLVLFIDENAPVTYKGTLNTAATPLQMHRLTKGIGYQAGDSLINEAFDFSMENYYPIQAQHGVLKRVIFPESFSPDQRFDISDEQRSFLLAAMHKLPREVGYDATEYYDSYGKFFLYGDSKDEIPSYTKIYNKVGYAHGTLTDCAYVEDTKYNVEFLLTATILVNENRIFNDDTYQFDEIGIPFLAELGRQVYQYELQRKEK